MVRVSTCGQARDADRAAHRLGGRGAFSPDGSLLALAVSIGNGGDGGATAMQLEVASVPGGRLAVVPGTSASSTLSGFG